MTTAREVMLRMRSVRNISQVTRALQAVSASKVRRAMAAMFQTRPYATKAWHVLTHIAGQPDRSDLHPLLVTHHDVQNVIVVLMSGDRGLAGAYNTNIFRFTSRHFDHYHAPVRYIAVGRKGRDLLYRLKKDVLAEFSNLPDPVTFVDVSPIGRLCVDEFLSGRADEIFLVYTDFVNMLTQEPLIKKLLPLEVDEGEGRVQAFEATHTGPAQAYLYEPNQVEIMNEIVPRFTALQIFQAVLESQASEHAARMVAMKNATDNATELAGALQLEYNKARQQAITNEMLDIAGGAEALTQARAR